MLDLKTAKLPSAVFVDGDFFAIHTDFRYWLRFYEVFKNNPKPLLTEFDYIYGSRIPKDRQKGFECLLNFANPKTPLPRDIGGKARKVLDYDLDGDLIFAAFYEKYHIDLFDEKLRLHWWKFRALLNGLRETKLNDVMGYRGFDEHNKDDYKQSMIKARKAWELVEDIEMSEEEKSIAEKFEKQFE